MADDNIDLSAPQAEAVAAEKKEVKLKQFSRDLSHILIHETEPGAEAAGPLLTIGTYQLQFKEATTVEALARLVQGGIDGMRDYVLLSLEGDPADFESLLGKITIDGLGEIINALGEGYSSFPAKS